MGRQWGQLEIRKRSQATLSSDYNCISYSIEETKRLILGVKAKALEGDM